MLRVLFVSRIPILVTFERAKTLPTAKSLAPLEVSAISKEGGTNSRRFSWELLRLVGLIRPFAQHRKSVDDTVWLISQNWKCVKEFQIKMCCSK